MGETLQEWYLRGDIEEMRQAKMKADKQAREREAFESWWAEHINGKMLITDEQGYQYYVGNNPFFKALAKTAWEAANAAKEVPLEKFKIVGSSSDVINADFEVKP